jgi:hypothetical protein
LLAQLNLVRQSAALPRHPLCVKFHSGIHHSRSKYLHSPDTKSFRITSFADPCTLTPIESHLYKKQGVGYLGSHPDFSLPRYFITDFASPF